MRYRSYLAAAMFVAASLAASAAPAPVVKSTAGPPVVFQFAPGEKLLDDVKKIVRIVAGDDLAKMVDDQIKNKLGEKGFAGLDMKKPIAGYVYLPNKALKGPEDFKEVYGILAIPVTGEEEFKDFVSRMSPSNDPLVFKPVESNKGLYSIETRNGDHDEFPVRARFHDGHLYIGINAKDELLDSKVLLPAKTLAKADESAMMLVRIFTDRYPEELLKQQTELGELNDKVQQLGGFSVLAASILKSYTAMSNRLAGQMKDAEESGFRLVFEEKAAEIAVESYAIPKKGTAYAKELAAMKPSENRFASLFTDKLAAGALFQLPIAAPEMRDIFGKLIEAGQKGKDEAPEFVRPVIDELLKGVGRTVKGESIDFALGVNGPDKDGKFTVFGAVTFDDATGLEKAFKTAVKNEEFKEKIGHEIKFDVEKIEGVNIHRRTGTGQEEGADVMKSIFGTQDVNLALGPKGIYIAMGSEWKAAMTSALTAKPAPAKVFDLAVNPKRLGDLIKAGNEGAGTIAAGILGTDDRRLSAFSVSYEGGPMLKARMAMNLKLIPKAAVGAATVFLGR